MGRLLQYKDKKDLFEEILEEWGVKLSVTLVVSIIVLHSRRYLL